jgi:Cu(I)/Ag(I) efflux system membrane fusion protein
MELVSTASQGQDTDPRAVRIDPVARRVAHIRTAPVEATSLNRQIRAVGELHYDEGKLKTLAAYVDGRLEQLFADYTGVTVAKGDQLAVLYSPPLYSSQVEFLSAKRARDEGQQSTLRGVIESRQSLYESAKQRLSEFGMTEQQIADLEQSGQACSRLALYAPISGTVIEKLAVEGQYVKEGQPIYRLADLSTSWLMLEFYPEDAAAVHYGQRVEAEVQSFPGHRFAGRVAFIDPTVHPTTRTVGVRVVLPNPQGMLRIGDYANALVEVPVRSDGADVSQIYDPELADKWISPRHPHVIESEPGKCPLCGIDLVPASQFGFVSEPKDDRLQLVVPRNAVLMAGEHSVVYVETETGRFELREVVLGPSSGDRIAIRRGVEAGENVAVNGNFLIDSQMQLAGKPSLIDPTKARAPVKTPAQDDEEARIAEALSSLDPADRALAEKQRICPVAQMPLGSMGTPLKVEMGGRMVFLCCSGCESMLRKDPEKYLAKLADPTTDAETPSGGEIPEMDLPPMDLPMLELPAMDQPMLALPPLDQPMVELPQEEATP